MEFDESLDPFSSESLWRLSRFSVEALQPPDEIPWNATLPGTQISSVVLVFYYIRWTLTWELTDISNSILRETLNTSEKPDSVWKLNYFTDELGAPGSFDDSIVNPAIETESVTPTTSSLDTDDRSNIWSLDALQEGDLFSAPLKSWEKFHSQSFQEPVSAYFSESGSRGLDAALRLKDAANSDAPNGPVRERAFVRSLLHLGLGWSSPFFCYNARSGKFEKYQRSIRVSGVSTTNTDKVISDLMQCGSNMLFVRSFAESQTSKAKNLSSLFTLRGTIAVVLYHLENQVTGRSESLVSLIQVSTLFRRCGELVQALADIIRATERAASDAQVISILMDHAAVLALKYGWIENLIQEIVVRVADPWLGFIEGWIGLRPEIPASTELIQSGATFVGQGAHEDLSRLRIGPSKKIDYTYQKEHMPSFIPADQAQDIFESGRSLRLLKKSHPNHPIARGDVLTRSGLMHLHFATNWADIEKIHRKAEEYESRLRIEILRYHSEGWRPEPETGYFSVAQDHDRDQIVRQTFQLFDIDDEGQMADSAMDRKSISNDKIRSMIRDGRDVDDYSMEPVKSFGPELTSGLYLSLAPVIASQSRLVDFSCLHHLFTEQNLRQHLDLQWRFQLLGDGSFVSRLSHSLFDPEMESGERRAGVVRSGVHTGLRLGSRDTWPPASSELRLVLIGLLGDCYFSEPEPETQENPQAQQVERCKDPNAIEALDFLRLQYKPPEALEALITQRSLDKYDRLFKQLLRLQRMMSVVKGLIRDSTSRSSLSGDTRNIFQKFRIDAQHFVLALSDYCFNTGVGSIWNQFQEKLSRIERCLRRGDIDGTIETAHSVHRLRDLHEDVLDQMLFAFFLSKRHAPAAKLLDTIFSIILAFSPLSKADGSGLRHGSEGTVHHLYATFRKQSSAFVGYLRGLDSGKASSKPMQKSGAFFASRSDPT
ncbi:hypothetical protein N7470_009635 [Penicillium chermesinum]|nr:hypothetical protein N7470_009635 [Penicillium chermesinum]